MNHKPTVVHIATTDSVLYSLLLNQLRCLRAAGYEVTGISGPGQWAELFMEDGFRHISLDIAREISPLKDLVALWKLYRILRREKFLIVHTHNPKPGLLGQLAARLAGVPIVVNTVHGFYFHEHMPVLKRTFYMTVERIAALCSDAILSQNKEDLHTANRIRLAAPSKLKYLGNGIDLTRFDPRAISPDLLQQKRAEIGLSDGPVVGFVGRLAARRKGFLDFLAAAQEILKTSPSAQFLIIGQSDRTKSDAVQPSIADAFGVRDNCLFLGLRPNSEMPLLYSLMDVLVLPSMFEGIPRAVMEASAMRVPVVATDVKGNRETVDSGVNGVLVPYRDVRALVTAIQRLLEDPALARRMGAAGREIALERFDERVSFDKLKAEYARLLHDKSLPQPIAVSAPAET